MRLILTSIFVLTSLVLSAQLNPRHIYVHEKEDIPNYLEIYSLTFPPTVTNNGFPDSGRDTLSIDPVNGVPTAYTLTFDPLAGFIGDTEIKIEYFEPGAIPGIPYPNYTTIHYRIKESKVSTNNDYVLDPGNTVNVFPLGNDSSTDGDLTIQKLGYNYGGSASIVNGDQIDFTFDSGSTNGHVLYFVEDSLGTVNSALVHLLQEDDLLSESRMLYADNKSSEIIQLPSANYEITANATHGTLSIGDENHVWIYTPNDDYEGTDYIQFTSTAGGDISYDITILDKSTERSFVLDDHSYVVVNGSVSFNVFENDLRTDFAIIDYSSELTYNGDGQFSYTPPSDFSGDQIFYYKVFSGLEFHTGQIFIHVDNYNPTEELSYAFEILNNHALRIEHHSPVETYTFSILNAPTNGSVEVLDANSTYANECDTLSGINTIIYTPDNDYTGVDEFDIEYCTTSNVCEIVKIDVNILDSNYEECLCLSNCVYIGDNNDDGIVNGKDILDIGLNIGNGGLERTNDFNLLWTGQESDNWGHEQMNSDIDLKCGDSDGDGYIDGNDFQAVVDHYGSIHRLMSDPVTTISNVPITFIPQQTEVDSGEWLTIDISIGSFAYPALDFNGAAFTFNINPDLIDSSSVTFSLYDDSWINDDKAPLSSLYLVPQDGQVDMALTRITGSVDGLGIIGKLSFIVEDEIAGFKDIEQLASHINIGMTNIISTNQYGEYVRHPDQEGSVKINRDRRLEGKEIQNFINIYPNPTSDYLFVESERHSIDQVEIFDALGKLVSQQHFSNSPQARIDLSYLDQGMYFVRASSNNQVTTKKVQKFDF